MTVVVVMMLMMVGGAGAGRQPTSLPWCRPRAHCWWRRGIFLARCPRLGRPLGVPQVQQVGERGLGEVAEVTVDRRGEAVPPAGAPPHPPALALSVGNPRASAGARQVLSRCSAGAPQVLGRDPGMSRSLPAKRGASLASWGGGGGAGGQAIPGLRIPAALPLLGSPSLYPPVDSVPSLPGPAQSLPPPGSSP